MARPCILLLALIVAVPVAALAQDTGPDSGSRDTAGADTGSLDTAWLDTGSVDTADTDPTDTADTDPTDTADTDPTDTADTDPTDTDPTDTDPTDTGLTDTALLIDTAPTYAAHDLAGEDGGSTCLDGDATSILGFPLLLGLLAVRSRRHPGRLRT